jgi:hypothetical protein
VAGINFGVSISAGTVCDLPARVVAEVALPFLHGCEPLQRNPDRASAGANADQSTMGLACGAPK